MCREEKINQLIPLTKEQKQKLYNEALAFYELAECGRMHIPEQKYVESHIPYIVNMTFCAELLLKFLLLEEGKDLEHLKKIGHDLKDLHKKLCPETKELIYSSFKRPLIYNINNELNRSKNAFVKWRYLVLDKISTASESPSKDSRTPFEKWLCLTSYGQKEIVKKQNSRSQISPFFLKEFNEVLMEICRRRI